MTYLTAVPQAALMRSRGNRSDTPRERHRDIMSLFGQFSDSKTARSEGGILFRLDRPQGTQPVYIIRSAVPVTVGVPGIETIVEADEAPAAGQAVAFRLAVNAVQRHGAKVVRPVVPDDQPLTKAGNENATHLTPWLQQRLGPGLEDIKILNHQRELLTETNLDQRSPVKGSQVKTVQLDMVEGVAVVGDPQTLKNLLTDGVGRAKAYGCGLLTIKRLG